MRVKYTVEAFAAIDPQDWGCKEEGLCARLFEAHEEGLLALEDVMYLAESAKVLKVEPA